MRDGPAVLEPSDAADIWRDSETRGLEKADERRESMPDGGRDANKLILIVGG